MKKETTSSLIDRILPPDGVGTQRELDRMELHNHINSLLAEHQARQQPTESCLGCRVPIHLHGTACGWSNARGITNPQNAQEEEWKRQWEEATVHWYGQQPVRKTLDEVKDEVAKEYSQYDLKVLEKFVAYITKPLPIQSGSHVSTDLGDGVVIARQVDPSKYNVNMIHKGYDQVFDITELTSIDTITSRYSPDGWLKIAAELYAQAKAVEPQGELIRYDIDFGGNVMAGIEAVGEIKIIGAMDGYGNGIPVDKINVTKTSN